CIVGADKGEAQPCRESRLLLPQPGHGFEQYRDDRGHLGRNGTGVNPVQRSTVWLKYLLHYFAGFGETVVIGGCGERQHREFRRIEGSITLRQGSHIAVRDRDDVIGAAQREFLEMPGEPLVEAVLPPASRHRRSRVERLLAVPGV